MCKNKQKGVPNPASLLQTNPPCGTQTPSPGPPKPSKGQDRTCLTGVRGCCGLSPRDSVPSADNFQEGSTFGLHVFGSPTQL